ncbi:MAG: hypothetical protein ABJC74_00780 [Gemmatimonadota bacterium]
MLLTGGALALPDSAWRRRGLAGLAALWLGFGSLAVVLGAEGLSDLAERIGQAMLPAHFLAGSAGLIALGLILSLIAAGWTVRNPGVAAASRWTAIVLAMAALSVAIVLTPLWRAVSIVEIVTVGLTLSLAGAGLFLVGRLLGVRGWFVAADGWLGGGRQPGNTPAEPRPTWQRYGLACAIVVGLIPTVTTLVIGTIVAATLLYLQARRSNEVARLPLLVIGTLCLIPAGWLLLTVAGSVAPTLGSLPDAPLSPAAELWIAPWLLVAGWVLLGQWPIQWLVPRPSLAMLGGIALLGIGAFGIPLGMQAFQPWLAPVLVISLWWALATRRLEMALGALALFGALAVPETGRWVVLLPFAVTSLLVMQDARPISMHRAARRKILLVISGCGLWYVLLAGLRTQVVYTVLCVLAVAVASGAQASNET